MVENQNNLEDLVLSRVLRLNAKIQGVVTGIVAGLTLFIATNWLVLKGSAVVGPHLSLLSEFFPGYRVTFVGSLVGLAYAFLCGFVVGYSVARMYNWIADITEGKRKGAE